ncbi:MAG: dihydrofolate reductase family protein, partial [Gemmatimonadetes bacterium]|nr:dihydrofolate reductase family protein [Gemmatimonadota bacterium]
MRPVRYNVAASLDGFIAGPHGEFDWIPMDPTVDFASLFAKVDTVLLGRRSYEAALEGGEFPWAPSARVFVFSRGMRAEDHPAITVVGSDAGAVVASLRAEEGEGEIWLFGGGELFGELLAEGQVDSVDYAGRLPRGAHVVTAESFLAYDPFTYVDTSFFGEDDTRSNLVRLVSEKLTKI